EADIDTPLPVADGFLVLLAESGSAELESWSGSALIAVAADKPVGLLLLHVSKSGDVDAVRTARRPRPRTCFQVRHGPRCAALIDVVHEIAAQRVVVVADVRVHQQARGFQRRSAKNEDLGARFPYIPCGAVYVLYGACLAF